MNRMHASSLALLAVVAIVGGLVCSRADAAVITSATLADSNGEKTITDFVANSTAYTVTSFAAATGASDAATRYRQSADPGSGNAALGDDYVTTGLLNVAGITFTFTNTAILAADVFFVTDINTSTGSADTFTYQAVDSGGGLLGSAFNIALSPGGSNTLLVFNATVVGGVHLNASAFTLADFALNPTELTQVVGVKLTNTGGAGDPGLVGLAQATVIPTPVALPAGLALLGALAMRSRK